MISKRANLVLLLVLSALWFFSGIAVSVIFSFALGCYGDAGEDAFSLKVRAKRTELSGCIPHQVNTNIQTMVRMRMAKATIRSGGYSKYQTIAVLKTTRLSTSIIDRG